MKDNRIMNEVKTTDAAEAEEEKAVTDLGKFKDVKALLEAYQALEAEFTRRSQKLKELEASKERSTPARTAQTVEGEVKLPENNGTAQVAVNGESPSQGAEAYCGGASVLSAMSEEMKDAVIEEYLNAVFTKRGVPFVTGGGAITASRRTPKTLREAGTLAGELFKNKEEK